MNLLKIKPADLTQMSKHANGMFPSMAQTQVRGRILELVYYLQSMQVK